MSKILIPDALKAIADERNFFLYQMPMKAPVAVGSISRPKNTDKAAVSTLWEVVEKLEYLERKPEVLEKVNAERAEWVKQADKAPKEIEGFKVGYVPREESAGVVVDLDKCVGEEGVVLLDDLELQAAFDAYRESGGYWEVSPSGTGVRVVLPRVAFEDELRSDRREAGQVAFQAAQEQAKGFTLTLTGDGAWQRGEVGDRLVSEVVRVRDAGLTERNTERMAKRGGLEDGDLALEWAHVSLEDLEAMLAAVPNVGKDRDWFIGMTKAIRETFEPRGLGEAAWDLWDAWTATREDGNGPYIYEENRRLWDEPITRPGEKSIGGLVMEAHEAGWRGSWESDLGEDEDDDGFVMDGVEGDGDEDAEEIKLDWSNPLDRLAIIGGDFFDRKMNVWVSERAALRLSRKYKMMDLKGNLIPLGKPDGRIGWLNENLRSWDRMDFWPGQKETYRDRSGSRVLNTYRELEPLSGGPEGAEVWVDQVRKGFGEDADLLFDWMAFVLQNPGKKAGFAPVLISEHEGAGKDFALLPMKNYLDRYAGNVGLNQIDDEKNGGILKEKMLLIIEESAQSRFQDKANVAEKLKSLIAAPPDTLSVRMMRKDHFEVRNVLNVVLLVNQMDALYMEMGTRRYYPIVTEFGRDWDRDAKNEWWKPRWEWMRSGGWKAVARWLLDRDVVRVSESMNAPESRWMRDVVRAGMPPGADWVEDFVNGRGWVSTRQIRDAGVMADGTRVPVGKVLTRVLEGLGYKQLGSDRISVRDGDKVYKHAIFVLDTNTASKEEIYEVLASGDDETIDKAQKRSHIRLM